MRAEKKLGEKTKVKMLYFTQLLGIALRPSPRKLGMRMCPTAWKFRRNLYERRARRQAEAVLEEGEGAR